MQPSINNSWQRARVIIRLYKCTSGLFQSDIKMLQGNMYSMKFKIYQSWSTLSHDLFIFVKSASRSYLQISYALEVDVLRQGSVEKSELHQLPSALLFNFS